jgi:predicted acyl esterase
VLPVGSKPFGTKALASSVCVDHDVEVVVRDGAWLYMNVHRPADAEGKVPATLS